MPIDSDPRRGTLGLATGLVLACNRRWLGRNVAAGPSVVGLVYAALIGPPAEISINCRREVKRREHGARDLTGESQPGRLRTPGREMDALA